MLDAQNAHFAIKAPLGGYRKKPDIEIALADDDEMLSHEPAAIAIGQIGKGEPKINARNPTTLGVDRHQREAEEHAKQARQPKRHQPENAQGADEEPGTPVARPQRINDFSLLSTNHDRVMSNSVSKLTALP